MEVTFTYTKNEWVDARRKYLFIRKIMTKLQLVLIPVFVILIGFCIAMEGWNVTNIVASSAFVIYALLMLFAYVIQPKVLFDNTKKYHGEYQLTFSDEGIVFRTEGINSELEWSIYETFHETEHYIYLVQRKDLYFVMPKRVFSTKEELDAFRTLVQKHVKGEKA